MVFPSDVVGEEDNDDVTNFQQVLASAKEKYLSRSKKSSSKSHRGSPSKALYSSQDGYQKSLDASAFSGRATASRRFATASRQFRTNDYGTASRQPTSEWESGLWTAPKEAKGEACVNRDTTAPIVSSLAKRLLDAEQKPLAGPPKALLDKLKFGSDEVVNAPPAAYGSKYRRHERTERSNFARPVDVEGVEKAAIIPPPPQSLLRSTSESQSTVALSDRGRQHFRDHAPNRNADHHRVPRNHQSRNRYDPDDDSYYGDGYSFPQAEIEPVRKKRHDSVSRAEKQHLLKEHFEARAQLDAVMAEMQASGNLLSSQRDETSDTPTSRKRAQAAERYDSLQSEKFAAADIKPNKAEVRGENDAQTDAEVTSADSAQAGTAAEPTENKPLLPRVQQMKKLKKQQRQRIADNQQEAAQNPAAVPKSARVLTKPPIALDCEFVGVGPQGIDDALARVSVVNEHGDVLYNHFVRPREPVTDYRTEVSGVRPKDVSIKNSSTVDFATAQRDVAELIAGRIIVGHAITNDLKVLQLSHPRYFIRDTQTFMPFKRLGGASRPSLRKLAKAVLDLEIHKGEHDSVEDARVAMQLYMCRRSEWERQLLHGELKHFGKKRPRQEEFNWHRGSKRLDRRMPRDENGVRRGRRFKGANAKSTGANDENVDDALMLGVTSGTALDR